jgi:hypothetical protein
MLNEEMVFEALSSIQWLGESPQTMEAAEGGSTEPARGDPASIGAEEEQANLNLEGSNAGSQPSTTPQV